MHAIAATDASARPARRARTALRLAGILFSLSLLAAACGDDGDEATTTTDADGGTESTAASTNDVLGAENKATGDPVKLGFISHGATESLDNQIELDVAEATVEWLNTNHGGMGGRPFELVTCIDGNDPAKAADCANQMIEEDVAGVVLARTRSPRVSTSPSTRPACRSCSMPPAWPRSSTTTTTPSSWPTRPPPSSCRSRSRRESTRRRSLLSSSTPATLEGFPGDTAVAPHNRRHVAGRDQRPGVQLLRHLRAPRRPRQPGKLHRFVNIYVNDEDVRFSGGLDTEISDGDSVTILPAVAGG